MNMEYRKLDVDLLRPISFMGLKDVKVTELDRYLVRQSGLQQPVICYPNPSTNEHEKFLIYAGLKTWLIAQEEEFQFDKIPAIIQQAPTESITQIYPMMGAGQSNGPRDVIAEAKLLQQVLNKNPSMSIAAFAKQLGRKRSDLSNQLRLLKLPIEIQNWIKQGKLSAGAGRALVTLKSETQQIILAKEVMLKKYSMRVLEKRIRQLNQTKAKTKTSTKKTPKPPTTETTDPNTRKIEQILSQKLGSNVQLRDGQLVIDYYNNLDVLEGLLEQMGLVDLG